MNNRKSGIGAFRGSRAGLQVGSLRDNRVRSLDGTLRVGSAACVPGTDNACKVPPVRNYFVTVSGEF